VCNMMCVLDACVNVWFYSLYNVYVCVCACVCVCVFRYHGLLEQGTFEGILSVNSLQKYHSVSPSLFDEASVGHSFGGGKRK